MSNAAQRVKTLIQGMAQDCQHYQKLLILLEQQREHIVARRADELNSINTQVMTVYQALSKSSQLRYRLLEGLGLQASGYGVTSLIARLPASHQQSVATLWQKLQQHAADCHTTNEYNGELMNMQQEILVNLLNVNQPENWLYQEG